MNQALRGQEVWFIRRGRGGPQAADSSGSENIASSVAAFVGGLRAVSRSALRFCSYRSGNAGACGGSACARQPGGASRYQAFEYLGNATRRKIIEHQQEDKHGVHPRLLLQLASGYGDMYELDVQEQLLRRAETLALAGREAELLPEIRCALADNLRLKGEYKNAWPALDAVTPLLEKSQDGRQHAACLIVRANLAGETARHEESIQSAQRALQLLDASAEVNASSSLPRLSAASADSSTTGRKRFNFFRS